jgi:LacI family transcriptional regulator
VSDVAGRAGVSPKTVSRALNNEGNVRPDKLARVRRAAEELGFRPNQFARLLRTRGTASMVGVVTASVGDPFWTGVLQGVEAVIGGGDRFILSASTRDRSDREAEIAMAMVERRVMALLVVPTAVDQSYLREIVAAGTPVVCIDRPAVGAEIDAVVADDFGGARRGMGLLTARGHRRIAFLGTGSVYTTGKRLDGYRQALADIGVAADDRLVHAAVDEAARVGPVVVELLGLADPPTAVFAADVKTAVGLLSVLRGHGWRPAIVAFSDSDAARVHNPTVTVIDNDPVALGRCGAELALQRLDGFVGPPRRVSIDTPIIERESHLVGVP